MDSLNTVVATPRVNGSSYREEEQQSCLTSDEVNFLIYRYLLESGFVHSAFVFGNESFIARAPLENTDQLPAGALIKYIQKGLQYVEIESHINDDGSEVICDEGFSILRPHKCVVRERKQIFDPYEPVIADYGVLEIEDDEYTVLRAHEAMVCVCMWNTTKLIMASGSGDGTIRLWDARTRKRDKAKDGSLLLENCVVLGANADSEERDDKDEDEEMEDGEDDKSRKRKGSKDSATPVKKKAKIGKSSKTPSTTKEEEKTDSLKPGEKTKNELSSSSSSLSASSSSSSSSSSSTTNKNTTILCLDWDEEGELLASGSYDASTNIWSYEGELLHTLAVHEAPVCCVRWCKGDNKLLSTASLDCSIGIWSKSGELIKKYTTHKGPVLDVHWQNEEVIASCSTDKTINIFNVKKDTEDPVLSLKAHEADINNVRWDSTGIYLASCSDDCAVKVWKPDDAAKMSSAVKTEEKEEDKPFLDLREHTREVCVISWSPKVGKDDDDEEEDKEGQAKSMLLASGSMDTTVKVWDIEKKGKCILTLSKHLHPVTSLEFSPSGDLLASGSHDRIHVWSIPRGELARTFKCSNNVGINSLSWSSDGKQLSAAFSDNSVYLMDVKML